MEHKFIWIFAIILVYLVVINQVPSILKFDYSLSFTEDKDEKICREIYYSLITNTTLTNDTKHFKNIANKLNILPNELVIYISNFTEKCGDYLISSGISDVKLGMGDSVSISIERNRWYGKIYENGEDSTLYIFSLIKLPLKTDKFNFLYVHILFIIIMFFSFREKEVERRLKNESYY